MYPRYNLIVEIRLISNRKIQRCFKICPLSESEIESFIETYLQEILQQEF